MAEFLATKDEQGDYCILWPPGSTLRKITEGKHQGNWESNFDTEGRCVALATKHFDTLFPGFAEHLPPGGGPVAVEISITKKEM